MIYDPEDNRLLLFGGKSALTGAPLQETWELRQSPPPADTWNWTQLQTLTAPPPRFSFIGGLARISGERYFVIATGDLGGGVRTNDVWAMKLRPPYQWLKVETEGDELKPRK